MHCYVERYKIIANPINSNILCFSLKTLTAMKKCKTLNDLKNCKLHPVHDPTIGLCLVKNRPGPDYRQMSRVEELTRRVSVAFDGIGRQKSEWIRDD